MIPLPDSTLQPGKLTHEFVYLGGTLTKATSCLSKSTGAYATPDTACGSTHPRAQDQDADIRSARGKMLDGRFTRSPHACHYDTSRRASPSLLPQILHWMAKVKSYRPRDLLPCYYPCEEGKSKSIEATLSKRS